MLTRADLVDRYAVDDRGSPHLRANMVASLDGAATRDGLSSGLSGRVDQLLLDTLRMLADVVVVGAGTLRLESYGPFRVSDDAVAWRRAHGLRDHPVLAVVSSRLALEAVWPVFADAPTHPLVLTSAGAPPDRRASLAGVADVVECGRTAVEVPRVREELTARGLTQVLCEGGPTLLGALVAADGVDELCLTLSPLLLGGRATRITTGTGARAVPMRLVSALPAGDFLLLRYGRAP